MVPANVLTAVDFGRTLRESIRPPIEWYPLGWPATATGSPATAARNKALGTYGSGVQAQRRQRRHARSVLVRHDRKPQLTQVVEFEAQVLPLKRRATWAKRVLLDQYLSVPLPSIRGRLHMYLLGSLLLCFFHLNRPDARRTAACRTRPRSARRYQAVQPPSVSRQDRCARPPGAQLDQPDLRTSRRSSPHG